MSELLPREKKAFVLHMSYSFLEGIIAGLIILNEFVFVKSLLGSNYQLAVLFQFSMAVFLLLIFMNEWLKRIRNKRNVLRRAALLSRLPLLLLFFFPRSPESLGGDSVYHYIFLGIFLVYYLGNTVIWPTINLFLKTSYRHENFSRLFSYATTLNKIVMMVTTFIYGWLLDIDNYIFVYIFPIAAVLGVLSVFLLSLIPYQVDKVEVKENGFWNSVRESALGMVRILRTNRPFLDFEIGFMLYGLGFMGSVTVIVLFFETGLGLNYSSIAFYKNGYNVLAIIMLPFFGKLMGRVDPRRFAAISFLSMLLYILFLTLTEYYPAYTEFWDIRLYHLLIFYILFHGVFAATMALTWFIGSAYFCPPEEAGNYQSVHLVLTAFRSLFAPLMGIALYEAFGFTTTFVIAMSFLAIGISYMLWSERNVSLPGGVKPGNEDQE
ncbi:MAG: MFS transporter [Bacteroidetes bacterium]|nr:MAG: MFS transporter [Bacteroidota bacterium]